MEFKVKEISWRYYISYVLLVIFTLSCIWYSYLSINKVGIRLTKLMFNFSNVDELADVNYPKVIKLVSEKEKEKITINDKEAINWQYFEFRRVPTSIKITGSEENPFNGFVKFKVNNKFISENREFVLFFKKNFKGKAYDINLYEVFSVHL